MIMTLRFPHADNLHENRKNYIIHPTFKLRLGPGTLFVFDPVDDLFFTHEAECVRPFEASPDSPIGETGWREAWVFRLLGSLRPFHLPEEGGGLAMDERLQAKAAQRKKARARQRERLRKNSVMHI